MTVKNNYTYDQVYRTTRRSSWNCGHSEGYRLEFQRGQCPFAPKPKYDINCDYVKSIVLARIELLAAGNRIATFWRSVLEGGNPDNTSACFVRNPNTQTLLTISLIPGKLILRYSLEMWTK